MSKQQEKARKIKQAVQGTFSKAISELEKANKLLAEAVEADQKKLDALNAGINHAQSTIKIVHAEKLDREAEIILNKELIAKLERFTK